MSRADEIWHAQLLKNDSDFQVTSIGLFCMGQVSVDFAGQLLAQHQDGQAVAQFGSAGLRRAGTQTGQRQGFDCGKLVIRQQEKLQVGDNIFGQVNGTVFAVIRIAQLGFGACLFVQFFEVCQR